MIGMVASCVIGLAASAAFAQVPAAPAPAAAPAAVVAAPAAPVAAPAAPETITVKGEVSVVNGPDGALQAVYINPPEPEHGYKVDIVNGEGKTLADKDGKIIEAVGVDANRLFTIQTVTVVE